MRIEKDTTSIDNSNIINGILEMLEKKLSELQTRLNETGKCEDLKSLNECDNILSEVETIIRKKGRKQNAHNWNSGI